MPDVSLLNKILLVSIVSLFVVSNCLAQNKVDLELTVQSAAKSVRGGENFAYLITVRNIGSAKVTDVRVNQHEEEMTPFIAYAPSKGTCEVKERRGFVGDRNLVCHLNDIEAGETVVISVEMQILDFGDVSLIENENSFEINEKLQNRVNKKPLEDFANSMSAQEMAQLKTQQNSIGYASVSAKELEENTENNQAEISVERLPSKNIPPRVKILSPQENAMVTRHSGKLTTVTLTIKAFDPDGTIEEVGVRANQINPSVEHPLTHVIIRGKEYSIEELQNNPTLLEQAEGGKAIKTGKDTYTYTIENPNYGINTVQVGAIDNGGRGSGASIQFTVKGDNSIEFTNPVKNAVIKPHTDISIETTCKLNDGKLVGLQLMGARLDGYSFASTFDEVPMKLLSAQGGVYRHQYTLKNAEKGVYNLRVYLTEDSGAFTYSEDVRFTVSEKPTVKINIPNAKQIFKENEEIPFTVKAADADGRVKSVTVLVNGEDKNNNWRTDDNGSYRNGYFYSLRKGTYTMTAKVKDDLDVEAESEPLTIVVK